MGSNAGADVLAKRHEERIDLHPILLRQKGFQRGGRFLGCLGGHVAPSIGDAVNVDVHADARLVARDSQHEVGAFDAHPAKGQELIEIARQLAAKLFDGPPGDFMHLRGLRFVEGGAADEGIDFLHG